MSEPVYMVWDRYDGPRTGIASFQGSSHYFACVCATFHLDADRRAAAGAR